MVKHFFATLFVMLAAGCTHAIQGRPEPLITSQALFDQNARYFDDAAVAGDLERATNKEAYRNQVVMARIRVIDARYEEYEQGLYSEGIGSNVGAGVAAFTLTTTSAALHNSNTQSILSTLAAIITGSQAVYNKEALFERTLPALIDTMRANRQRARASIVENMAHSIGDWPLPVALMQVDAYHEAGDLNAAINDISAQAVAARATSTSAVEHATHHFAMGAVAQRLRSYLRNGASEGPFDTAKLGDMATWLRQNAPASPPGDGPIRVVELTSADPEPSANPANADRAALIDTLRTAYLQARGVSD